MHAPSSEYHHGDASSAVSLTDSSILLLLLLQTAKVAPGGVEVTTGGGGGAVRVWDVRSWRCVDELPPSTYGSAGTRCALQRCEQSQMRCDAVRRLAPPTPSPGVYRGAAASQEGLRWFGVLSEGSSLSPGKRLHHQRSSSSHDPLNSAFLAGGVLIAPAPSAALA